MCDFSSDKILESYVRMNEYYWEQKRRNKFPIEDEEEDNPDDLGELFTQSKIEDDERE